MPTFPSFNHKSDKKMLSENVVNNSLTLLCFHSFCESCWNEFRGRYWAIEVRLLVTLEDEHQCPYGNLFNFVTITQLYSAAENSISFHSKFKSVDVAHVNFYFSTIFSCYPQGIQRHKTFKFVGNFMSFSLNPKWSLVLSLLDCFQAKLQKFSMKEGTQPKPQLKLAQFEFSEFVGKASCLVSCLALSLLLPETQQCFFLSFWKKIEGDIKAYLIRRKKDSR